MKIWLTTDTHFGHDKIIEYCHRPPDFADKILKGFNVLKPGDVLLHLGDFCIGNDFMWHLQFKAHTKGIKKWFVLGNHDHKSNNWYLEHGWDWIGRSMTLKVMGQKILFTHIPKADDGSWDVNIHGHFHNSDHRSQEPELQALYTDKHKLLAIEYTNYQPVLLETFLQTKAIERG